ncbi:MAG: tyrosine-type recombinase/integrase [Aeromicrobium erythreum]
MRERRRSDGTVSFQVMFRDGKKQRSRTFESAKDAQRFADRVRVLGAEEALSAEVSRKPGITLDEVAALYWPYLETRVRSDRTVADYRRDYTNWISTYLGWRDAATIDERAIQSWIDRIKSLTKTTAEGDVVPRLSAKSVADRHAILHGIFKWASSPTRQIVPAGHNPCIGTELPPRRRKQPQGLRPAEWQALHAALQVVNSDAADLAEFLVASGWRWSEATALDTYGVEDSGTTMWVTMSQVARRNAAGKTVIVKDAKSQAGKRRIKIDKGAAAIVRRRLQGRPPGSLVFTTTAGYQWDYGHFNKRYWTKAVKTSGIRKVTPHVLRHTAVGYLALSGKVSMPEIQRRIGHQSIQTTIDVYGGMIEDVNDDALDFLEAMRNAKPIEAREVRDELED